jgi:hypothetical protein
MLSQFIQNKIDDYDSDYYHEYDSDYDHEYDSDYHNECAIYEEHKQFISNKTLEYIRDLPQELKSIIFYFIPLNYIRTNEAKLIGNIMSVYRIDHHHDLTRMAKKYFIHNIMPFYDYVFMTLYEDEYERCDYGREEYDTLELSSRVIYELQK